MRGLTVIRSSHLFFIVAAREIFPLRKIKHEVGIFPLFQVWVVDNFSTLWGDEAQHAYSEWVKMI
ncbi:MAG: hypothetical protein COT85_05275 [Chlamydiae bacterium CG10_big_fil_rev_8_21_14_0_10_42_34]|nr:MAG: hypothetical protein COT85_05275 [Chlamydiae bacterium CG10_big_fil_rev_8_21_14_0_10_42_34]